MLHRAWFRLALILGLAASAPAHAVGSDPILIGQSGGFSGGQAEYAKDIKAGIDACFAAVNATGGVNGRALKLVSADDGGKKDQVLANTKKLAESDAVLALVGYTSGAGTELSLPYISAAKLPILSAATGNMGIRAAFNPYVFHTRAGYDDEMSKIAGFAAGFGITRIGLAYLDDVGPANLKSMQDAVAAHRLEAAAVVGLDRNAENFTAQIDRLMAAKPDLVIFISNAKPIVKIIHGMRERGYHGMFATSSFAGSRVVADLKQHACGLIMIQVLPQPHKAHLQFHREFHTDTRQFVPDAKPNYTMLEGYIAARVLVEGLRRVGPNPSRERLVAALDAVNDLNFGGYRIRFSKDNHNGSRFVDLGVVNAQGALQF